MSFLGKFLVVLNTGLSIIFLMWAVSVYFEKLDWFTNPETKAIGIVDKSQTKLKELNSGAQEAARRWGYNAYEVAVQEYERPLRRDFYRGMLASVQTGKGQVPGAKGFEPVDPPVPELKSDPITGLVPAYQDPDRSRRVSVKIGGEKGADVVSIEQYKQQIADAAVEIEKRQKNIVMLIDEHRKKTDLIFGTPTSKGLRTMIAEQELILKNARAEFDYLQPIWTRRFSENATLIRRLDSVGDRVKELEKFEESRSAGQ